MANVTPNSYKVAAMSGTIAPLTDTIKVALFTSSLTPNGDTQAFFSDVSANEISGTGYTAGGVTLAGKTVTQDNVNDRGVFTANNPSWAALTAADIRYAIVYKSTGTSSTSPLMEIIDLGAQSSAGGTFSITWNASGISYIG